MSEPVFNVEDPSSVGLESVGPFEVYRLRLDGYRIPKLEGRLIGETWHFTLDGRFGCEVPKEHGNSVAWMIANALAIGEGYSCFGKNSQISNPYTRQMLGISIAPDIEMQSASESAS